MSKIYIIRKNVSFQVFDKHIILITISDTNFDILKDFWIVVEITNQEKSE